MSLVSGYIVQTRCVREMEKERWGMGSDEERKNEVETFGF